MSLFLGYALLAVFIFFIFKRFFLKTPHATESKKQLQKKFEEKCKTLHCDGSVCNPKNTCSKPEILVCRDVIAKVIPNGYFKGQFWIDLPRSGSRRVDFAIETPEGRRIVVEFDGYAAHREKMTRSEFNKELLRQNELICSGWTVLRFSFGQVLNNADQCRDLLRAAMNPSASGKFTVHYAAGLCPSAGCGGSTYRCRSKKGELFWKCDKCECTFDHDKISPVPRS